MALLDAIVPRDSASSYVTTPPGVPRITVRPSFETRPSGAPQDEGVEPPPAPENAAPTFSDASDETDNAPPVRIGLFDDIVSPAGPGHAPQGSASDGTDDTPPASTVLPLK